MYRGAAEQGEVVQLLRRRHDELRCRAVEVWAGVAVVGGVGVHSPNTSQRRVGLGWLTVAESTAGPSWRLVVRKADWMVVSISRSGRPAVAAAWPRTVRVSW